MLAQDDTVIFVGSGISRWSGLPSWEGLIGELAKYLEFNSIDSTLVRQEASEGDLLQAASYGFLKLTPPQIADFIRKSCKTGAASPSSIHQVIMALGPTCFITTNYDDLLEQAYRAHRQEPARLRIVLNKQLFEQADIIHARAREFIFKPHGDACAADSLVLTRDQYRMLMPQGAFHSTLHTLSTLLQSRPVLFLGFGLRDPDFVYLRDVLANIYRGGMRDHYAIVADPVDDQREYWRVQYGIHLIGYKTTNDGRDHSELLNLLESLKTVERKDPTAVSGINLNDSESVLALARYAASCVTPIARKRFDIRVLSHDVEQTRNSHKEHYSYWPVSRLLLEGPNQFVLLGEPGAGKSFAIREATNTIATAFQQACLLGQLNESMRLPIVIDLKQYDGDLVAQIDSTFSGRLSLSLVRSVFPVTLYLDGYNELPREFREDGNFDRQLSALLAAQPGIGLVIGSRTLDGLEHLKLPTYSLSEISESEIERWLTDAGILLPAMHGDEIKSILQRPFYYHLVNQEVVSLHCVHTPGDLYAQFLQSIYAKFSLKYGDSIDLRTILQRLAFDCLERGHEAFALSNLAAAIASKARQNTQPEIDNIANWLASAGVFIPLRGNRGAFVHQSVTEYLAACELKNRMELQTENAEELINLRRWDSAIYLVLGMLDDKLAKELLSAISLRDIEFAFRAARYAQFGVAQLVDGLLTISQSLSGSELSYEAAHAFLLLPFSPSHEVALRRIMQKVPALRGFANAALSKLLGNAFKQELIDNLFDEGDFNALQSISEALALVIQVTDLQVLIERAASLDPSTLDDDNGTTNWRIGALAKALSNLPISELQRETFDRIGELELGQKRIIATLLCDVFNDRKSADMLPLVLEILRARWLRSSFSLYLGVRFDTAIRATFLEALDDELFHTILDYVDQGDQWSIELLETCGDDERMARRLIAEASRSSATREGILRYCVNKDSTFVFELLESYAVGQLPNADVKLLEAIDSSVLDWTGRHDQLLALLLHRNLRLATLILGGSSPPEFLGLDKIDLGEVTPWIDWIVELKNSPDNSASWVSEQLAVLLGRSSAPKNKAQLLAALESHNEDQRSTVAISILLRLEGLTLEDISPLGVDYLISLLELGVGNNEFRPHVFARIADEAFVRQKLFPLALNAGKLRDTIAYVTQQVGRRLGVRLVLPPVQVAATTNLDYSR